MDAGNAANKVVRPPMKFVFSVPRTGTLPRLKHKLSQAFSRPAASHESLQHNWSSSIERRE